MHPDLAELFRRQHGVVSLRQMRPIGLTPDTVRTMARRGDVRNVGVGVYRHEAVAPSWLSDLMGAVLWTEGVVSHRSAARLHRLEPFDSDIVEE